MRDDRRRAILAKALSLAVGLALGGAFAWLSRRGLGGVASGLIWAVSLVVVGDSIGQIRQRRSQDRDLAVLAFLGRTGSAYALQLVQEGLGSRGTIYVRLGRLEVEGLLVSRAEALPEALAVHGFVPRSYYTLTHAGAVFVHSAQIRGLVPDQNPGRCIAWLAGPPPPEVELA